MRDELTIAYRGNFRPAASTESHVSASMESLGCNVIRIQEDEVDWPTTVALCHQADLFLWTSTFGYAEKWSRDDAWKAVRELNELLPTVAYHLDLFWGLDREDQIRTVPWFRLQHVFTTDNWHDRWLEEGVNHHYLPPGVYHAEAYDGTPQRQFQCDVAFVGSWRSYGHAEHWPVREKMLQTLRRKYGRRFQCFPKNQAVRGTQLTDLYASVKVVVGDSCLAGQIPGYTSDRVPETMGRGGLLIHPYVDMDVLNAFPHMVCYRPGDFATMVYVIDQYLADPDMRESQRRSQAEHTRRHHTYAHKMQHVLDTVLG